MNLWKESRSISPSHANDSIEDHRVNVKCVGGVLVLFSLIYQPMLSHLLLLLRIGDRLGEAFGGIYFKSQYKL